MLAALQTLVNENPRTGVPEWLLTTATKLHSNRADAFLRTNCQATCARLRYLILPDETRWVETLQVPSKACDTYMVKFGEDHEFMVIKNRVFQSYAFKHEAEERALDLTLPLYKHISCDPDGYHCYNPEFYIPQ
jgi:hypothetical protein